MEVLPALFIKANDKCLLLIFPRVSTKQRVSLYAEDVAIFLKPTVLELVTDREVISAFGTASGLRVNYLKSSAIVIRGDHHDELLVNQISRCSIGSFPCKYLELQLCTGQLNKVHWQELMAKVLFSLLAWQAGSALTLWSSRADQSSGLSLH
jgi:hypothetical protein